MKRTLSFLLSIIMTASIVGGLDFSAYANDSVWNGKIATSFAGGNGSQSNPYLISNGEQLAYLSQCVNNGNTFSNKYFLMTNDIMLNDTDDYENWNQKYQPANQWKPMGTSYGEYNFRGSFNGGYNSIYGLYSLNGGLFGCTRNAKICNLSIQDSYAYDDSVVGVFINNSYNTTIEFCYSNSKAFGTKYVGGFTGRSNGNKVKDCLFYGEVDGDSAVGGFFGDAWYSNLSNLINYGYIHGGNSVGGICGEFVDSTGGDSYAEKCINKGIIEGANRVGGLFGYTSRQEYNFTISKCENYGSVSASGNYVGGIVGYHYAPFLNFRVFEVANFGDVLGNDYVAGIVGVSSDRFGSVILENCYNTGKIQGRDIVAGIFGACIGKDYPGYYTSVSNCYNQGSISASSNIGQIIGKKQYNDPSNCYYPANRINNDNGTEIQESEFSNQSSFIGFNFNEIWEMSDFPILKANKQLLRELECMVQGLFYDFSENEIYIKGIPKLSENSAMNFLCFLYNDDVTKTDIANTTAYKILTGNFDGTPDEYKATAISVSIFIRTRLNSLISESEFNLSDSQTILLDYLNEKLKESKDLPQEIIDEYMGKAKKVLVEGIADFLVGIIADFNGVIITDDMLDWSTVGFDAVDNISDLANKVADFLEYSAATIQGCRFVLASENLGRYNYFSSYLLNRENYSSNEDYIFKVLDDSNFEICSLNTTGGLAIDSISWITGKNSWTNHRSEIQEWAEFTYQLESYSQKSLCEYKSEIIEPTCINEGYTLYTCIYCGDYHKEDITPPLGHDYYSEIISPTCTSQGYTKYTCKRCNYSYNGEFTDSLGGHTYEYVKTLTPTCTSQGYDLYTCSVCSATEKRNFVYANGHNYLLTNHIGSTCNTTGYDEYTCSVCGDVISEEIALLDGSALEAVLEEVQKKLSKNFYTTESIANLQSVYNKHKNGLDVYTTQTEVDNAVEELNTAISELIVSDTASGITENGQSWTWSRETGELKVVGEGNLPSYNSTSMPWCELLPYTISIIVDKGITSIGSYSFYKAENVTNISLPYGITTIGNYAFSHCSSVEELVVPNSVTSIGNNSFSNLTSLKKVSVPASTTYRSYAFSNSKSVEEIIITPGVDGIIPNSNITTEESGWSEIFHKKTGNFGPWKYTENATVTILEGVTSIGDKTFYDCYNVLQYNMPDSLTHIGVEAFRWCYNLKSIDIPKNVTAIDFGAFYQCGGLTNITIPNSVTTIGASAFEECNELTDITISESVISIGDYAFNYCFNLANVYYTGSQAQWNNISIGTDNSCLTDATIHYNWIEINTDVLTAALEMFDSLNSADYLTQSYSNLSIVVEEYRTVLQTAQSQQEIDDAVTAILEVMYDLVPYLNLNISAENGSYQVQYDSSISSDSEHSLVFGTEVTLTATANDGYDFVGWYDETSGVYLSKESTYTFSLTANMDIKAVFVEEQSATLTFTTYSDWLKEEITKTVDEWNEITSIEDMLPEVPYRYGYSNGRWVYDNEDVLAKLRAGENVSIVAEYDADDTSLPTPPTPNGDVPVLDLYYKLDADENIGSFVMATGIPENCQIESVGMAFYYKNANQFNPENFELLLNNKMLTSTFELDESNIYIANIERFTSKNNWAVRGYITYYDSDGNLKTVYSNQINIVGREQV